MSWYLLKPVPHWNYQSKSNVTEGIRTDEPGETGEERMEHKYGESKYDKTKTHTGTKGCLVHQYETPKAGTKRHYLTTWDGNELFGTEWKPAGDSSTVAERTETGNSPKLKNIKPLQLTCWRNVDFKVEDRDGT